MKIIGEMPNEHERHCEGGTTEAISQFKDVIASRAKQSPDMKRLLMPHLFRSSIKFSTKGIASSQAGTHKLCSSSQ
jgi:hypothetical protein